MDAETLNDAKKLYAAAKTGKAVEITLETDDRVLARVTDGIYRQPSSAIRELIANAYDADATEVVVLTDAPRYSEIIVRDNGNGMTAPVLCNMIRHIGGSAKRTLVGQESGVTDKNNSRLSPGGRKLIGKMGIGLFSVSQLTRQFTIITKPKTENFRYTAVVTLRRYSDDGLEDTDNDSTYLSGNTAIRVDAVKADEPHGTTILLGSLMPRSKRVLQSQEMWNQLHSVESKNVGVVRRVPPKYHSGLASDDENTFVLAPDVPWNDRTPSTERMRKLFAGVVKAGESNDLYLQVDNAFDYYYKMVWSLGLALPLRYLNEHPFQLPGTTQIKCFQLSNRTRATRGGANDAQASELTVNADTTVADAAAIEAPNEGDTFDVQIDGLTLYRPICFNVVPGSSRALDTALLFVGSFNPDLSKFDESQRGGKDLYFSGYFYWTPRVVPKEHNGLLVRINGASGTLFDSTFLNYQISERQRLKQLIAEVFVSSGLEEALNIDRESFNTSHPHYQILLNWVHNSLRQVFNRQKELEGQLRAVRRQATGKQSRNEVQTTRDEELRKALGDDEDTLRKVAFTDDARERESSEKAGIRVYPLNEVIQEPVRRNKKMTGTMAEKVELNKERAIALVQLLDAYELLDHLSTKQQADLVASILRIFNSGE